MERVKNSFGHFAMENWFWLVMNLLMERSEQKLNSIWVNYFLSNVIFDSTFNFWPDDFLRREAWSRCWFEICHAWWYCWRFCWNMQSCHLLDISHSWQPKLVLVTSILSPLVPFELESAFYVTLILWRSIDYSLWLSKFKLKKSEIFKLWSHRAWSAGYSFE